jgi:23S rRNA pseudouridine2605 synthase
MKLQKFLALQSVSSRRKAEELIAAGRVAVNGSVAAIGACIDPSCDRVAIDGSTVSARIAPSQRKPLVLILNKPNGYVCSHGDRYNPNTIFDLVPKEFAKKKLMFCGRLDKDTEGLIVLTDDGNFAQLISHPSFGIKKYYRVLLSRQLPDKIARQLLSGIESDGEFLKFDKIAAIGSGSMRGLSFEIALSHGKKNEIRRAFEHFGIFVQRLRRTRIGGFSMRGISVGRCRRLDDKEIASLLCGTTSRGELNSLNHSNGIKYD